MLESAQPLVRIERSPIATRAVGPECLRDLDLEIEPGELVVLAGRSARGKTTLLRACCGLVPHFHGGEVAGAVEVAGLDVREHGPAELGGAVGFVAQDPETQVVSTTVRGELELPLEMRGEPPAARARAVEEVALALAIPHLLDRTVDTLSGGELQRVALAAALVGRPRLVLLDEPTSQLDPVAGDELIWLLRRLNEEWGVAVLLAEHRLERCLAAADRVIAMVEGRIAFDGAPGRLPRLGAGRRRGARDAGGAALRPRRACARRRSGSSAARAQLRRRTASSSPLGPAAKPRSMRTAPPRASGRRSRSPPRSRSRDLWVELDDGGGSARRPARHRPRRRAGRAGRADGPQRRRQEHAAAGRGGTASSRSGGGSSAPRRLRAAWPRAPATSWSASGSATSCPARRAVGRSRRSGSSGRRTPTRATSPAASASGWRWRS